MLSLYLQISLSSRRYPKGKGQWTSLTMWYIQNHCILYIYFFNWRITSSQYCGGICHKSIWISPNYIYMYKKYILYMCVYVCVCIYIYRERERDSPTISPLQVITEHQAGLPVLYTFFSPRGTWGLKGCFLLKELPCLFCGYKKTISMKQKSFWAVLFFSII